MRRSAFETCHPLVLAAFFVVAVALCIVIQNPLFQLVGLVAAACAYLSVAGARGFKLLGGLMLAGAFIAVLNPLFSSAGDQTLFTVFGHPYTFESLAYGISTALMFMTMLLWFACFARVMTGEKISYLLGGIAPSLALVLSMLVRLIPSFRRRAADIVDARACIGKSARSGPLAQRVSEGSSSLSTLVSWSLEDSIVTANSMRSRGYGLARRSNYARYAFCVRDGIIAILLAALAACVVVCLSLGAVPDSPLAPMHGFGFLGWLAFVAYTMFLMTPFVLNVIEELAWQISVSRI